MHHVPFGQETFKYGVVSWYRLISAPYQSIYFPLCRIRRQQFPAKLTTWAEVWIILLLSSFEIAIQIHTLNWFRCMMYFVCTPVLGHCWAAWACLFYSNHLFAFLLCPVFESNDPDLEWQLDFKDRLSINAFKFSRLEEVVMMGNFWFLFWSWIRSFQFHRSKVYQLIMSTILKA